MNSNQKFQRVSFWIQKRTQFSQPLLQKLYKTALSKIRQSGINDSEMQYEIARITYAPAIDLAIRKHALNITLSQRKEIISATKLILERIIQKNRFKSKSFSEDAILNKEAEVLVRILGSKATLFANESGLIAENLLERIMPAIQLQMIFDRINLEFKKRP